MKFVVYGDAEIAGSGSWCYADTLVGMGHQVLRVPTWSGLEKYSSTLIGRVVRKALGRPLETHRKKHVALLLEAVAAERPQVVVILKGLYISGFDVQAMRRLGAWVVNINHDDFFSRNPNNWSKIQRSAIPSYDFVFATREVNVGEIFPLNPRVEFLPFAYHPRIHRRMEIPAAERTLWNVDVVFVGTWEAERCHLLEHLVQQVPARYSIWGGGWENAGFRSVLRPYIRRKDVMLDEMAKAICGAQIALGFLRKKNRDDYTQRTFEIPACGGVLLAERTPRHQMYFQEGIEAEFFDPTCPDELVTKTRMLLTDESHREAVRTAGLAALLRQRHTYQDRLDRLLELYEKAKTNPVRGPDNHLHQT